MRNVWVVADTGAEASRWAKEFGLKRWVRLKKTGQLTCKKYDRPQVVLTVGDVRRPETVEVIRQITASARVPEIVWIRNPEMDSYRSSGFQMPVLKAEVLDWRYEDHTQYLVTVVDLGLSRRRVDYCVTVCLDVEELMTQFRKRFSWVRLLRFESVEGKDAAEARALEIRRMTWQEKQALVGGRSQPGVPVSR